MNVQCGYRTLDVLEDVSLSPHSVVRRMKRPPSLQRYLQDIYTEGCLDAAKAFVEDNLYLLLGVIIGLLVFEIFNVLFAAGLVVDINREKQVMKAIKRREKGQ